MKIVKDKINKQYSKHGGTHIKYDAVDYVKIYDYLKRDDFKYSIIAEKDTLLYRILKHNISKY